MTKPIGTLTVEITFDGQGSWKHPSNGTWAQMRFHRALSYSIPLDGYVGAGSGFDVIDRREAHPSLTLPNFHRYVVLKPRAAMSAELSGPCGKGESQILDEYKGTEVGDPGQPPIVPYTETWKGGGPFPSGDRTLSERNLCMTRFALDNDKHVVHIALDGADSEVKTQLVHNGFQPRPFNVHLHGDDISGSSAFEKLTFLDVPVPAGAKSFELSRVIENFSRVMGKGRTMVPLRATVKWRVTIQ